MSDKTKVLFGCTHNSARSQMAEAYLNDLFGDRFEAESAGIEPGELNPLVVKAMKEDGVDISKNTVNDVFEYYKEGRLYSYVVTVCERDAAEKCPLFPGVTQRVQWSFSDPSKFTGTEEEKMEKVRQVRDEIKGKVKQWAGGEGE